ncbi:rCG46809 [Rattus norvegicus]|uniref:RCG46809 n=1 Tax=Rattus norvegicus TaxID=10116 RepID=A6IWZ1_RAT|nr:rCG46809 [Rattus norvegicus]
MDSALSACTGKLSNPGSWLSLQPLLRGMQIHFQTKHSALPPAHSSGDERYHL